MLWPVFYLIFIFAITQISHSVKHPAVLTAVLALAMLLQFADAGQVIRQKQSEFYHLQGSSTNLTSSFWNDAAKKYHTIEVLPLHIPNWQWIGEYASRNHMRLNYFYFARINQSLFTDATEKIILLQQGKTTPGELYLIKDPDLLKSLCKVFQGDTFFAKVNNEWVIAPGFDKIPADYPDIQQTRADLHCK
jgi:hypothetical protein